MTEIFYTKEGIGDDVLFLHGWGGDINSFKVVYDKLTDFRVFAVDMAGFGKTPPPKTGWGVEDYADSIARFVEQNCSKNLVVVGHSFGGRVGVVFAAKYPRLIKKLVLVSSAGLRRFNLKRQIKIMSFKIKKRLAKYNKKMQISLINAGSPDYISAQGTMKQTFVKVTTLRLNKYAKKISCPTLLIWGAEDKETPLWMAKKYNKLIKNSGLVVMENCGHFCFLQNPSYFFSVLNSFLKS